MQQKTTLKQIERVIEDLRREVSHLREQMKSNSPVENDVVMSEVKGIYKQLQIEKELLTQQIVIAIDANDYVKFTQLKQEQSNVQVAIDALNRSYGDEIKQTTLRDKVTQLLSKNTSMARHKGEKFIDHMDHSTTYFNNLCHKALVNTTNIINSGVNHGIQMNNKLSHLLIHKFADSLDKLSEKLKK